MNLYATPDQLTARTPYATGDEALLMVLLQAASRMADGLTGRHFYSEIKARLFEPQDHKRIDVPDLLAVSDLAIDRNGAMTFGEAWNEGSDFVLWPWDDWPKLEVQRRAYASTFSNWPICGPSVRITGSWGYGDGYRPQPWDDVAGITITLTSEGDASAVLSASGIVTPGMTLLSGTEQMFVQAVSEPVGGPVVATVKRAMNGTTPASAHTGVSFKRAVYPELVTEFVLWMATQRWKTREGDDLSQEQQGDYSYVRANLGTMDAHESMVARNYLGRFSRHVVV